MSGEGGNNMLKELVQELQAKGVSCTIENLGGGIEGITFPNTDYFVTVDEVEETLYHLTNGEDNGEQHIVFTFDEIVQVVTGW
jgi:hypothetical protein